MPRAAIVSWAIGLAATVCSAAPFGISRESIEALKPPGVAITSITAAERGARVVAYDFTLVGIPTFLRQLEGAGATNIQLLELTSVDACERRFMRAEFKIEGDASRLVKAAPSADQLRVLLRERQVAAGCVPDVPL